MNAVAMLTQCRARQDNVSAGDSTSETVAYRAQDTAPDVELFIGGVSELPGAWELMQEAKRLGLDS